MDKREGSGGGVGLHWETLGVGVYALLQQNGRGGDGVCVCGGAYINVLHQGAPT